MSQRVYVYIVRYVENGATLYMHQSYDFRFGTAVCKQLAIQGKKPVLVRVRVAVKDLTSSGDVSRRLFAS